MTSALFNPMKRNPMKPQLQDSLKSLLENILKTTLSGVSLFFQAGGTFQIVGGTKQFCRGVWGPLLDCRDFKT